MRLACYSADLWVLWAVASGVLELLGLALVLLVLLVDCAVLICLLGWVVVYCGWLCWLIVLVYT